MRITHLSLTHFRNYTHEEVAPAAGANLLLGDNAQGKSNLLEAIVCLSTTRSFRTSTERHLINRAHLDEALPYARLVARVESGPVRTIELAITIERENDVTSVRRHLRLDGVPHRLMDALGSLPSVLFTPDDICLVAGPPADRRRYLDVLLCQADRDYCRALSLYNRSLTQRNHLLRLIRRRRGDPEQLHYWDGLLAENGAAIVARRRQALAFIAAAAGVTHAGLAAGERLEIAYAPSTEGSNGELRTQYLERRGADIERGTTTLGPHRDDFRIALGEEEAAAFVSRGQMRTIALTLRLVEADYMAEALGRRPLLLFDDVMSELDGRRRRALEEAMLASPQSYVTDLDERPFSAAFLARARLFRVAEGHITAMATPGEGDDPAPRPGGDTGAESGPPF